jgi:integrase/recombinase XerD
VHRTKTNAEVFIPLPPAVAQMLRAHANDHPDYFFWNPERMKKTSLICQFGDWLRLVFDKAGVKHGQQEMLSHRLRHTFAVELLLADVPIEQVSKLNCAGSVAVVNRIETGRALSFEQLAPLDKADKSTA